MAPGAAMALLAGSGAGAVGGLIRDTLGLPLDWSCWVCAVGPEQRKAKARNINIMKSPAKKVNILDNKKHHHLRSAKHSSLALLKFVGVPVEEI